MSLSKPRKRLLQSATSLLPRSHFYPSLTCPHLHQRRTAMKDYFGQAFKFRKGKPRAILDPATFDPDKALADEKAKEQRQLAKLPKAGGLAPGSILDAIPDPGPPKHEESPEKKKPAPVDPRPRSTARWQRKMVIRAIRSRGRITKEVKLARMERKHLSKSEFIKTSVKKLYPLARQIAGKPLAEAMVQMRFSRKKAAQDVLKHLEYARDQAIVTKGMGLGKVQARQIRERSRQQLAGGQEAGAVVKELEQPQQQQEEKLIVEDKKGKKRVVTDRTAMYVDEAWVGRGQYRRALEARARGQSNRLMLPYTSISVVLKEEATRIRQAEEREAKRQRKKVWVPLPDRPVTAQRQYPLW